MLNDHRIIGERENLAPGLPTVSFTVKLGGGDYTIYCPGAQQEIQPFTIVREPADRPTSNVAELLAKGTRGYAHYVAMQVDTMVTAVARLKQYIDAGKLAKARKQYSKSRVFYERIESHVAGFVLSGYKSTNNAGSLDYLIDMRFQP